MYRLLPALALAAALMAASDSASAHPASAALYPNKPVRLLVGFPPGAAADNVSRIIANALAPALGQPR
jgi:tripartite-type tricarboxylate transporter receptor subunit TctC